jgi:hypothetical protein
MQVLECIQTKKQFRDIQNKSGVITKYLKSMNILDIDYLKYFNVIEIEDKKYIECPITKKRFYDVDNASGQFTLHVLHKLNYSTVTDFCLEWPEYQKYFKKKLQREQVLYDQNVRVKCAICGEYFRKISNTHLKLHLITADEYKLKYGVKITSSETSRLQSIATTTHNLLHGSSTPAKNSKDELDFINKLIQANIQYEAQYLLNGKRFDVYIPNLNLLVELNGTAFHTSNLKNLNLTQLHTFVNDYDKIQIANNLHYKLIQIRYNKNTFQFTDLDSLKLQLDAHSYLIDSNLQINDIVLSKEYLIKYKKSKGALKLQRYIPLLIKYIRIVAPDIIQYLSKQNLNVEYVTCNESCYNDKNFYFVKCNNSGTNFLKSVFMSYFKSHYLKNSKLEDAWNNDEIMYRIIKYRIGINNSNEVFDFSVKNILRGYQVNRYTVSWFKPSLAAAIYKHFLGNLQAPTVLDPCAGFGARMLGFYSMYPNGVYIGVEPNTETFNELVKLNQLLGKNSILINDRYENVDISQFKYDIAFTSIPYWDTEIYSNDHTVHYDNFEDWKKKFLNKIQSTPKLVVNIPQKLRNEINVESVSEYKLIHNTSHFDKNSTSKFEYILECN